MDMEVRASRADGILSGFVVSGGEGKCEI